VSETPSAASGLQLLGAALARGARISVTGITLGALAGLSGLVLADAQRQAAVSAGIYWLLAPIILLVTLVVALNDLGSEARQFYSTLASAAALLLTAAGTAVVLASLLFNTLARNAPVFLRTAGADVLGQHLAVRLGPGAFLGVLALALLGAAAIAFWAHRQAAR
jgi:hypothetical protein